MFDPSKVKRGEDRAGDGIVAEVDFDACATALAEARADLKTVLDRESATTARYDAELDKLNDLLTRAQVSAEALAEQRDVAVRVVKQYRALHPMCSIRVAGLINATQIDDRCPTCKAADEVLGGK